MTSYELVMQSILPNIPTTADAKTSYTSNNNVTFNVLVENGLIYLCASDSEAGRTKPFAFLNEIRRQFSSGSLAHRALYASEGELNRDFAPVLANQMEKYSSQVTDQLSTLQSQVEEVKDVMTQNIERVLERGQRLEDLMDKTNELEASASTFQKTARRVQRHMCWRNTRMTIILIVVSILVVGILILIILFSTGVLPPKGGGGTTTTTTTTTTNHPPSMSN